MSSTYYARGAKVSCVRARQFDWESSDPAWVPDAFYPATSRKMSACARDLECRLGQRVHSLQSQNGSKGAVRNVSAYEDEDMQISYIKLAVVSRYQ
eukprot:scaffold37663_cov132-Skeletonema_marinoi.AAC.2